MYKKIFRERQKELLLIANSLIGREILGIKSLFPVTKVVPNGYHQQISFDPKKPVFEANLYTSQKIAFLLMPILTKIDLLRNEYPKYGPWGYENYLKAIKHYGGKGKENFPDLFLLSPLDAYAGAGDGFVQHGNVGGASFATIHDAADATFSVDPTGASINAKIDFTDKWFIARAFLPIDTSSIEDNAVLSAAVLHIWPTARSTDVSGDLVVVATTQASNTTLALADYDQVGTTALSNRPTLGGLTLNAYNDFTLNSTGRAAISLTGFTKIGIREGHDFDNSQPGLGGNQAVGVTFRASEQTGTSNDPYITITYTIPSSPAFFGD